MKVVVGVAGSIAAYKAPGVIRLLRGAGHEVRVVPTQAALRFIGAPALAAVSGHPVSTGVFDDPAAVEHVALGEWAELVLVAPASADLLARVRAGRADDLLTATILTTTAPVVLAPAMHTQMWDNPATVDNVATLRSRGMTVIEPDVGALTSGDSGRGRFPEPERVVTEALAAAVPVPARKAADVGAHLPSSSPAPAAAGSGTADPSATGSRQGPAARAAGSWDGRHVVVSAGGTHEPIDPVRFLGNRSSGRQGVAIAAEAARRGAAVTLVAANVSPEVLGPLDAARAAVQAPAEGSSGPVRCQVHSQPASSLPTSGGEVEIIPVGTALELEAAVRGAARTADVVVMAAAVADFRPAQVAGAKIKKHALDDEIEDETGHRQAAGTPGLPAQPPAQVTGGAEASGGVGLTLRLVENPDILAGLVTEPPRTEGRTLVVGFAAETGDGAGDVLAHGAAKARRKGVDLLAVNAVGNGLGFGDVPNAVVLLDAAGRETGRVAGTKAEVAAGLLDAVETLLPGTQD